jgi:hypothetical protein
MTDNKTYNELKAFLEGASVMRSEGDKPPKGFEKFFKKKEQRDSEKKGAATPTNTKGKILVN